MFLKYSKTQRLFDIIIESFLYFQILTLRKIKWSYRAVSKYVFKKKETLSNLDQLEYEKIKIIVLEYKE